MQLFMIRSVDQMCMMMKSIAVSRNKNNVNTRRSSSGCFFNSCIYQQNALAVLNKFGSRRPHRCCRWQITLHMSTAQTCLDTYVYCIAIDLSEHAWARHARACPDMPRLVRITKWNDCGHTRTSIDMSRLVWACPDMPGHDEARLSMFGQMQPCRYRTLPRAVYSVCFNYCGVNVPWWMVCVTLYWVNVHITVCVLT